MNTHRPCHLHPGTKLITVLALLLAAGCAAAPANPLPATALLSAQGWRCADGSTVISRTRDRGIELQDGALLHTLRQVPAASGARHEGAGRRFWSRGTDAMLTRDGGKTIECVENRRLSLNEDARSRGVTLRAQGNEPGWVLEIGPGARGSLNDRYGQSQLVFEQLTILADGGLEGLSGNTRLRVDARDERCRDDMSEEEFPVSVRLTLNGQTRRGCGVRLP